MSEKNKEEGVLDYRMIYEGDIRKGQLIDPETKKVVKEWIITDESKTGYDTWARKSALKY
jgi:hypothetical protein